MSALPYGLAVSPSHPAAEKPLYRQRKHPGLTPCVADDDHSPAYTAETALERTARRHARARGGYTVRLDSLPAPGSAANDDPRDTNVR